jgi:predicted ATPase
MKEKITIKNFSILKDIEFEINKINILIGEQASGKSLISKLIFFFKRVVLEDMFKTLYDSNKLNDYANEILISFKNIFPNYFWLNTNFLIIFQYPQQGCKIEISQKTSDLRITLSNNINEEFKEISISQNLKSDYLQSQKIQNSIRDIFFGNQSNSFFIPATRSFFSVIQKNVYKLDLSDLGDEFFIKRFGILVEYVKERTLNFPENKKLEYENILKAKYYFDGNEEWLIKGNTKVRLRDSSTGQQELVYLVLFLATLDSFEDNDNFFIIEEPGAHIFPSAQKQLVELFSIVFNTSQKRNSFLITSHSPYILTCFNNLLQGQNTFEVINQKKKKNEIAEEEYNSLLKKLNKILPEKRRICFEDLSVYLIKDGKVKDIKDHENRLIDADPIDDVSEIISEEFSNLLDIKYGG